MEALKKKERGGCQNKMKMSLAQRNGALLSFNAPPSPPPALNANVLVCRFFLNFTWFWTKLRVLVLCFPEFTENSIVLKHK